MSRESVLTPKLPELAMRIQPKIIDHLGINMYTAIHPVLSELVANSWDAESHNVYITIPEEDMSDKYFVSVRDDGSGMTYEELLYKYLQVGRNRRIDGNNTENNFIEHTPKLNRRVLGRKGIGKLSVFGVAQKVVFKSVKGGLVNEFEMDVEDIKKEKSDTYKPKPLQINQKTNETNGVTIILKNLNRKRSIHVDELRKGLARRFTILGDDFQVHVNKIPLTLEEREYNDIERTWLIDESLPGHPHWKIKGRIYTRKATISEEGMRGISIFAGGKLVQEPTLFKAGASAKTFAYSHMLGELDAEFLDEEHDVIATNRSAINWESEEGQALQEWGFIKLKKISTEWSEMRVKQKTDKFMMEGEFKLWFDGLTKTQQRTATKVINGILGNDSLSDERTSSLLSYIKNVFDYKEFQELSQEIEKESPENTTRLIELFQEWEILEAKEMYHILEGRVSTIEKLRWYLDHNAKEIPVLHDYLKKFPWIMDPRWTLIQDEARYSDILRKKFPDHDKDKRIDFLCFGSWPNVIVIEIKRPGVSIGSKELDQIREYVIAVEGLLGNDIEASYKKVYGYLICEDVQKSSTNAKRIEKLQENGIFIRKYSELLSMTEHIHDDMLKAYRKITENQKKT